MHVSHSSAPRQWDLPTFVDAAKAGGFVGVEMSLSELGRDSIERQESAAAIRTGGLRLVAAIGGGINTKTSSATQTPSERLKTFESQLNDVSALGNVVSHINCRGSGDYRWDVSTSAEYLADVLPLSAHFLEEHSHIGRFGREVDIMGGSPHHLTGISHETWKGGVFWHPNNTRQLLEILPPVRLTSDISYWHAVCGHRCGFQSDREEGGEEKEEKEEEALKIEIVPHIDYIRARTLGVHERTSIDDSNNEDMEDIGCLLAPHEVLWKDVWTRKAGCGVEELSITPDVATNNLNGAWRQTLNAARHIRQVFDGLSDNTYSQQQ